MNVPNPISGNGDTNGRGAKVIGVLMAMLVLVSMVSMPVMAFDSLDSVSDVDESGTQTITVSPSGQASPSVGDTIELSSSDVDGNLDYSNATVSTDGNASLTNNSGDELDVSYTVNQADVDDGGPIEFTISGAEATSSGQVDVSHTYTPSGGTAMDAKTQTAPYVDTSSETTYEVSGVVTDSSGDAVEGHTVIIVDSNEDVVDSLPTDANGSYSVSVPDGDYEVISTSSDGAYTEQVEPITVSGSAVTQDFTLQPATQYEFSVEDDGTSVDEFTFDLYDADNSQVGDSVEKTDGSAVTVSDLVVGDEYTAQVTVQEENEDGEMVDVSYEETFTAQEVADGDSVVTQSLDINTMNEVSDDDGTSIIDNGGETASNWFDSLVQEIEDQTGVSADLALVIGGSIGIIVIGGTVIVVFRGVRSSF